MLKLPPFDKGGGGKAVNNQIKILAVLLSIALAACGPGEQTTGEPAAETPAANAANAAEHAANQISGDLIRKIVKEISDDRYEGRGPAVAAMSLRANISPKNSGLWALSLAERTEAGNRNLCWCLSIANSQTNGHFSEEMRR